MIDNWLAALREDWIRAVEEEKCLLHLFWAIILALIVAKGVLWWVVVAELCR